MKRNTLFMLASALTLGACNTKTPEITATASAPEIVVFETDMGNDIDDALALNMLYKYMDQGLIDLVGISINKPGDAPAEFIDILDTWYGYPNIPVGIVANGADEQVFGPFEHGMDSGTTLAWINQTVDLSGITITAETKITVRNSDDQWPSASALRWFLDNLKIAQVK